MIENKKNQLLIYSAAIPIVVLAFLFIVALLQIRTGLSLGLGYAVFVLQVSIGTFFLPGLIALLVIRRKEKEKYTKHFAIKYWIIVTVVYTITMIFAFYIAGFIDGILFKLTS